MTEFSGGGYEITDRDGNPVGGIHIGKFRKSVMLYGGMEDGRTHVMAYFRSEEQAALCLKLLECLVKAGHIVQ